MKKMMLVMAVVVVMVGLSSVLFGESNPQPMPGPAALPKITVSSVIHVKCIGDEFDSIMRGKVDRVSNCLPPDCVNLADLDHVSILSNLVDESNPQPSPAPAREEMNEQNGSAVRFVEVHGYQTKYRDLVRNACKLK